MTNSIDEIAGASLILAIGTNTTEAHPVISLRIRKALQRGAKLIVVDPRKTELAELATSHLQLKPGTDIALFNSMARYILGERIWNKEFVAERCEGLEGLRESLGEFTPEYAQTITGIPAALIKETARAYAQAERATILYTMGLTQHACGTDNVLAVANLALLCGQIGRESTGLNPLRGQNNVQGACDMGGLPNVLPGYQQVQDEGNRKIFSGAWGAALSDKPGLTLGEMMDSALQGTLKAMYITGENPILSDADSNHVQKALEKLDFLVVQDMFLTDTAKLADVVLPAASFAEKEGTFTNTERRVQRVRKAIEPIAGAKPDWQIICALAAELGYPMKYAGPKEIFEEITRLTPSYRGISYQRLEKEGIQWPCPSEEHPGTKYLHNQTFVRGKARLTPVNYMQPKELPDEKYPLMLNTGRRLQHYHTGTMTLRTEITQIYGSEKLDINPGMPKT
ncbi:hypothetical protein N752_24915 [Desulforamulus aquiferis]|nr:hypothetical protein N752_24915 [Desulforamulus aquiferis]